MIRQVLDMSIKAKLYGLVIFFILFPFLFFGFIWYSEATKVIEKNAINDSEQLVRQLNSNLNDYFQGLERTVKPVIIHPVIQEYINLTPNDNFGNYVLSKRIEKEIAPEMYSRGDVISFNVASNNQIGTSLLSYEKFKRYKNEEAPKLLGFELRGINNEDSIPVITLTRSFVDYNTYKTNGMFIINLKINKLKEITENDHIGESGFIWITDGMGKILYHPIKEKLGTQVSKSYLKDISVKKQDSFIIEILGEKRLITYHTSLITNLTIITEVPLRALIGKLVSIRTITITLAIVLITTALILVGGFSLSLTKSLTHLQILMKKAESGNFQIRAPEKRTDEIGKLDRSFNKMVSELQRLVQVVHKSELKEKEMEIKQRESSLKAMQSQINPHFLYNTLELINSHAILEGNMTISKMATSLADMFRYNISNLNQIVTLYDEIEHVTSYLDIQKERYEKLEIICDYNEELIKRVKTVKLILQPIIENAFEHGYEKQKIRPSFLAIKGNKEDHVYYLDIIDHGKGMPEEIYQVYQNAFSKHGMEDITTQQNHINRIGLWNVHTRIRLTFGEPYGLRIAKSDESGTIIRIILPFRE
jgi:two-component system, sensor histidine kinase YesM